ncbi:MAG: ImmA/IrrE family metallo-endopeptidase [Lachnospiraceae bacterium]|nr:ImmA/IrrE family metallo-endopeptidase [Lachnospiraceae bacterium]
MARINTIEICNKALELRRKMGEDGFSPVDIFAMVQRMSDITLIMYPLGEHISGYCRKYEYTNIIVINSNMSVGRQRFSLAHELYHILYDSTMSFYVCMNFNNKAVNEQEADLFASYFLMPQTALSRFNMSKPVSVDEIVRIEQYYHVSRKAVLFRLLNEGLISKQELDEFSQNVRYSAKILGYSDSLYLPSPEKDKYYVLGKYISDAKKLYTEGRISDGKYEEYLLAAYRDDLVYGLPDGGDSID